MLRRRKWRTGLPAMSASVAAVIVGELISWFAREMGAFESVAGCRSRAFPRCS